VTKDTLIKRLEEIGVISREEVVLRSGESSNFYCDIKKAFGYPDILNALADEVGKKLPNFVTCVAASGYGGLSLASVVASRFNRKFVAIRTTSKNHGRGGMIDGYLPKEEDVVVIVDDVLTSGSSIRETLSVLEPFNTKIDSAIVAVKRGDPKLAVPYFYIFDIDEISGNKRQMPR
jgi:orotate phosphoribosyltransferase